jgi:hypothetical protein
VQDLGRHRVEEGLGELGLVVVDQQADVVQLDLLPHVHRQRRGLELALQALGRLVDPLVVVLDPQRLGPLLAVPVGRLEARLGLGAGLAEEAVVAVEALEHRLRDGEGAGVGQCRRKGRRVHEAALMPTANSAAAPGRPPRHTPSPRPPGW